MATAVGLFCLLASCLLVSGETDKHKCMAGPLSEALSPACLDPRPGPAKRARRGRSARSTLLLGGWPEGPDDSDDSYSVLGAARPSCPALPPLPRPGMWDPAVGLVRGRLVTCYTDYSTVSAPRYTSSRGSECWSLALGRPEPRAWQPLPAPPRTRFYPATATIGSRLLLIGGSKTITPGMEGMAGTTTVQRLHLPTGRWTIGRPLPGPLFSGCAVRLPRGVLVLGDFEAGAPNAYLLSRGAWLPLPLSTFPHENPACGRARLGGEEVAVAATGNTVEYYSPRAGAWRALPAPAVSRAFLPRPSVGVAGGRLVITGGMDKREAEVSRVVEAWDEAAGQWVTAGSLATARSRQGEVQVPEQLLCPLT